MWLYLVLAISSALALLHVAGIVWSKRRRAERGPGSDWCPPITILKPLCGVDDRLRGNLESFFQQCYPQFELIFGVEGSSDPAIAVVEELRRAYPDVRARLVLHNGGRGLNPKVSNLCAMLEAESHDLVVVSDSNVRVAPSYLREMSDAFVGELNVGLVTHLFYGTGERTVGATLENLQLNGWIAGNVAASHLIPGETAVIGKSLMFRRSELEPLGGLASLANILAEDHVLGQMYRRAGYAIRLAPRAVANVCAKTSLAAFGSRQLRWAVMRSRLVPMLYALEWISYPLAIPLLAVALGEHAATIGVTLAWALTISMLRDAAGWLTLRGPKGLLAALPLVPLKELAMLAVWLAAPLIRQVDWRGNQLYVSSGTRLFANHELRMPRRKLWLVR
ncbi:MAG: glycosyltransferase [Myxococcales bacterium]|nr:glycosyltransferase [Myxococcales bacterium]